MARNKKAVTLHKRITARGKKAAQDRCRHLHQRVSWSATHLFSLGFGGYYRVGIFDTTVICMDCDLVLRKVPASAPLCEHCHEPMVMVSTDKPTQEGVLAKPTQRFKAKQAQDWQRYDTRKKRIEAERGKRQPPLPPNPTFFELLDSVRNTLLPANARILQGNNRQQVRPYLCWNKDCRRRGVLKFLHTPGD